MAKWLFLLSTRSLILRPQNTSGGYSERLCELACAKKRAASGCSSPFVRNRISSQSPPVKLPSYEQVDNLLGSRNQLICLLVRNLLVPLCLDTIDEAVKSADCG